MRPWLFRLSLSHLSQNPGRTLLGLLGIALGTAVYLSISLAADRAIGSFQAGVTAVAGQAQWRVQSPGAPLAKPVSQAASPAGGRGRRPGGGKRPGTEPPAPRPGAPPGDRSLFRKRLPGLPI